ncbi:hypothetical protein [Almyronema epifaneia]|uniref:hypothetical protein n=1 Tax=Almyronema epifaneia TaxID=3114805 RepID=UPI003671D170
MSPLAAPLSGLMTKAIAPIAQIQPQDGSFQPVFLTSQRSRQFQNQPFPNQKL